MEKCFKPINMDKEICTERFMELPVEFDEATGTCSYLKGVKPAFDKNTDDITFKLDYVDLQQEIIFSCLGQENPRQHVGFALYINCKRVGDKGVAFHCIQHSKKGLKPELGEKILRTACEKSKPAPGKKTEFVKRVVPYGKK